ncbi:hypothetical protein P168DRAFT_323016 [Aspergillus campestris IBT 28561]|uniref:U3-containing 90S pre-ribosomal complex subunit-domain containing protein n=1 Tax=Aspergillus campestris (strain IBT 28561) TaxID=1392248 RepID=A0A2I1DD49_ASPC2|nr:uncharacterized protein P168DRAFT_323016 [Aspergillus campestris IBT 28561]PKY07785.1 hypothetical protein P168DRAFT_323016 [Aspergillus campestris IBT 28561]
MAAEKPSKSNPSAMSAKVDKKRKRQAEEPSKPAETPSGNAAEPTTKKAKSGKGKNKKDQKKMDGDKTEKKDEKPKDTKQTETKGGIDEAIGKMDGRLIADHFVQRAKRHNKELTAVELSDMSVPDSAFLDTSSFDKPRQLEELPAFLKAFSPNKGAKLSQASEKKGAPNTLVISGAALRSADVVRALRTFQHKESIVAKLFAKHIKLEEAKQFLQRSRSAIGAGTPARISDLIDAGSLNLEELERIVIDGSYVDQKQRGIFDMKETHFPLLKLLNRPELRERYGAKKKPIQILVY